MDHPYNCSSAAAGESHVGSGDELGIGQRQGGIGPKNGSAQEHKFGSHGEEFEDVFAISDSTVAVDFYVGLSSQGLHDFWQNLYTRSYRIELSASMVCDPEVSDTGFVSQQCVFSSLNAFEHQGQLSDRIEPLDVLPRDGLIELLLEERKEAGRLRRVHLHVGAEILEDC